MKKVIGSWLLDISKYVATAMILSAALGDKEHEANYYIISVGLLLALVFSGLALIWSDIENEKKDKKNG